jgi:predicted ATPase
VLVIEDAQWADGNTLFLIRHLARRARATRLRMMIVLTYRPDELKKQRAARYPVRSPAGTSLAGD